MSCVKSFTHEWRVEKTSFRGTGCEALSSLAPAPQSSSSQNSFPFVSALHFGGR